MNPTPPLLARAAVRWLVARAAREEIEGDLLELFQERAGNSGVRHARLRYWHDAATAIWKARAYRRERRSAPTRRTPGEATAMMVTTVAIEIKHAVRVLARYPGYAAVAALTLALGIGATVAIYTVVNAVLLRPLPYPDSDRILEIRHHAPGLNMPDVASSPGLIREYRDHARTLVAVGGYHGRYLNLADGGTPERLRAASVTPDLLTVLAVRPALGRAFEAGDSLENAPGTTILTDAVWRARFGGDPGVIGRTVRLDGQPAEIIGVMPPGFLLRDPGTRLLVPARFDAESGFGSLGMTALARLAPGATVDSARREIDQLQARIPEWFPGVTGETLKGFGWSVTVESWRDRVVADVSRALWVLLGTVGFVLLIAGTNVANLFLVRAEARQRELAVRSALGAGAVRIAVIFLSESVVLAAIGGGAGIALAAWATRLLVAYGPAGLPRLHEVRVDTNVIAFAVVLSLVSAAVLGLLPVLSVRRQHIASVMRDAGRGNTAGRGRHRVRRFLILTQVATAVVLLVGSGLMVRSALRLAAVNPGFDARDVVTSGISLGTQTDRRRAMAFYDRVLDEMSHLPGVESVGATSAIPVSPSGLSGSDFAIKSRPMAEGAIPRFAMYTTVTSGYFETLRARLVAGRLPVRADADQDRSVAWVNESLARMFLDGRAVGESIQLAERWLEIVGVIGDMKTFGLREEAKPMIYLTTGNATGGLEVMYAVVRTAGNSGALASGLRNAVDAVDRSVPITTTRTMEEIVEESMAQTSFTTALLAIAAVTALTLGVVGLYGVISFVVSQRASEIGIRLALGARPVDVCALVLRQGLSVAVAGVAIGLVVAAASTRLMASLLFEVSAYDPATFAAAAVVLIAVSAAATYVPARRAAAIDPADALRL